MKAEPINEADVAASFQEAAIEVLSAKLIRACKEHGLKQAAIAGGVSANSALRERLETMCKKEEIDFYYPPLMLCTDNAAMIGSAGYYEYINGYTSSLDLNAKPGLRLGDK